jgi:hypothetical protein
LNDVLDDGEAGYMLARDWPSTEVAEDGGLSVPREKPVETLNFGLHWYPKEGYKSMKPSPVILLASFSRFTRFCALSPELFDPLECARVST